MSSLNSDLANFYALNVSTFFDIEYQELKSVYFGFSLSDGSIRYFLGFLG